MRIILANSEKGWRGGEFQTIALARGLQHDGCEVMIAARSGSVLSKRVAGSILSEEYRFEAVPIVTPIVLARLISRWRPDILHAQTSDAHTHLWLARKLLAEAPPLVVSRRVAFRIGKDPFSLLKYRTGVAHYIPISRAAAASLLAQGVSAARLTLIPSGVDVDAFKGAIGSPDVKRRWGIESGDIVIGTIAAFEVEKGHETLVRAAADILREVSGARFILVGEGRLKAEIEGEIRRAGLAGRLACVPLDAPLEEMLPLFDIFVLPSLEEGLSTALIAAMAAGLAVVASMTGGIPDVVSSGTGILVPPGDHEALSRAIMTLIHDEGLRRSMGDAGVKRAADFSIGRTVETTLGIYRSLIEKKSAG